MIRPIPALWIPSHCGIKRNEEADKLSIAKNGAEDTQSEVNLSYPEKKTVIQE